jgi:hypothetical protein
LGAAGLTRNDKILAFVADGGTFDQAAAKFNVTRNVVCGVCRRAGLRVGQRYNELRRENGRRNLEGHHARVKSDPAYRAKWIAAMREGRARSRITG